MSSKRRSFCDLRNPRVEIEDRLGDEGEVLVRVEVAITESERGVLVDRVVGGETVLDDREDVLTSLGLVPPERGRNW